MPADPQASNTSTSVAGNSPAKPKLNARQIGRDWARDAKSTDPDDYAYDHGIDSENPLDPDYQEFLEGAKEGLDENADDAMKSQPDHPGQ